MKLVNGKIQDTEAREWRFTNTDDVVTVVYSTAMVGEPAGFVVSFVGPAVTTVSDEAEAREGCRMIACIGSTTSDAKPPSDDPSETASKTRTDKALEWLDKSARWSVHPPL